MAKRIRQDAGIPSITNPTQDQLSKFFIIAKNINNKIPVTDDDYKFFVAVAPNLGQFDEAKFKQLSEVINRDRKPGETLNPADVSAYIDEARKQIGSPENKDRLARIMAEQDAKNKTTAFSNAVNLFLAGTDLTAAQRQVSEYKNQVKSLQRPGALPVQGRDPYLAAALRSAETAPARETVSALAAGQQLGDIYRSELMQAPVAAGGQAGAVGALSQAAATRRRRGAMEMMPALEQIRAQQMGERTQLAGMSAQEGANINRSMQEAQVRAMDQYNKEAQAAAALGAAGYQNRLTALGELGSALTPYAARQRAMPVNVSSAPVQAPSPVMTGFQNPALRGQPLPEYARPTGINPALRGQPIDFNPISKYASTAKALGMPDEQIQRFGLNTLDQRIIPYRQAGIQYGLTERLPGQVPNLGSPLYEFEQQY
jgi:hypothetical protein